MNTQHSDFVALAKEMIEQDGRPVVLVSTDRSGDQYSPSTTTKRIGVMAVQTKFKIAEMDGDLIRSSDKKFLIDASYGIDLSMRLRDYDVAAHSMIPLGELPDEDVFDGREDELLINDYAIVMVDEVRVGSNVILNKVYART